MDTIVTEMLAERGVAPPLFTRCENGLLYRFLPGCICEIRDLMTIPLQ